MLEVGPLFVVVDPAAVDTPRPILVVLSGPQNVALGKSIELIAACCKLIDTSSIETRRQVRVI